MMSPTAHFDRRHRFQRTLAFLALMLLSPLLVLLALLVLVSSRGPILYRQTRVGQYGQRFVLLKFRSMRTADGEARVRTGSGNAPGGIEGTDRRTAVGRVLRRHGLDELPQLINVVRGDMALIGPRPERDTFSRRFEETMPDYARRLCVQPGITGLAQVRGLRGQSPLSARLQADLEYLHAPTRRGDLAILLRTVKVVVRGLE